jgi:tetratricopeptide (TPR) repeat protein
MVAPTGFGQGARAAIERAQRAIANRDPALSRLDHPVLIADRATPPVLLYRLGVLEAEGGEMATAARLMQAAHDRAPKDPNIAINLAQTRLASGDPAASLRLLGALEPSVRAHPAVRRLAGLALVETGKHAEAVVELEAAQKSSGGEGGGADPAVLNGIGVCRRALGQTREAVAAFTAALGALPANAPGTEIRGNLAALLILIERPEEALRLVDAGLARAPLAAVLQRQRAAALRATDKADAAMTAARRAAVSAPAEIAGVVLLADMLENRADLEAATRWVVRAGVLDPRDPAAMRLRLRILRRSKQENAAIDQAERFLAAEADPARTYPVLFELGQAHDALRQVEPAFEAFSRANQAQRAATPGGLGMPGRALAQLQGLDRLIEEGWRPSSEAPPLEGESPASQDETPPSQGERPGLVFAVGFPRSGTTLLDQVLDAHPAIAVLEERPLIPELIARLAQSGTPYPEVLKTISQQDIKELREHYHSRTAAALSDIGADIGSHDGAGLIVDKMPLNMAHVGLIRLLFPEARFILSLRDPCDVVLSCFMQSFRINDWMAAFLTLDEAATLYDAVFGHWQRACAAWAVPHVSIRYEDMVADLEGAVTPVLGFLGLDWRADMARFHDHARGRARLSTPSAAQVTRPIYTDALARWRRYDAVMAPIAARLEPWRKRHGYPDHG